MITKLLSSSNPIYLYGKNKGLKLRTKNAYQRSKYYSKFPQIFKRKTLIRPPDLTQQNIQFPIYVPIRVRHIYKPTAKPIFQQNSQKIKWNRLSPNQILLGFENIQYLTWEELVQGLQYLSNIKGQQNHNWNQHQWVKSAFDSFYKQMIRIKKDQYIKFYYLMKKLRNNNEQLWSKIYQKIQFYIYDLYPKDLQMLLMKYYDNPSKHFSQNFKQKLLKMCQGRMRQFKSQSILKMFDIYMNNGKLVNVNKDTNSSSSSGNYYLQNVFIPLFKEKSYKWTNKQTCQILRYMMIIQHQSNNRLYDTIYNRILTTQFTQKDKQDVQFLIEVIQEVQQIFTSHRVQDVLNYLHEQKQKLKDRKQIVKKTLTEIVKQDLIYFIEKRKLKGQSSVGNNENGNANVSMAV